MTKTHLDTSQAGENCKYCGVTYWCPVLDTTGYPTM